MTDFHVALAMSRTGTTRFDRRKLVEQAALDGLIAFMRTLSVVVDNVSLTTPENLHDAPFIRVTLSGVVEHVNSVFSKQHMERRFYGKP
jgi:hypothetical protein